MGNEIMVSDEAANASASLLRRGVSDYCAFGLCNLSASAPVSGSGLHDGAILSALRGALSSFADDVESDASMEQGICASIKSSDGQAASAISRR